MFTNAEMLPVSGLDHKQKKKRFEHLKKFQIGKIFVAYAKKIDLVIPLQNAVFCKPPSA